MLGAIILILAGLLIALYPPLLSLIVASLLILVGVLVLVVAIQNRRLARSYRNPIVRVFFQI